MGHGAGNAGSPWDVLADIREVPPVHFLEIGSKTTSWEQSGCPGEAKGCGGCEETCLALLQTSKARPQSPRPPNLPCCLGNSCMSTIHVQKRAVKSLLKLASWAGWWGLSGMGTQSVKGRHALELGPRRKVGSIHGGWRLDGSPRSRTDVPGGQGVGVEGEGRAVGSVGG